MSLQRLLSLIFVLLLQSVAIEAKSGAAVTHRSEAAYEACGMILQSTVLLSTPDEEGNQNFCDVLNQQALGSMAHCLVDNFNNSMKYVEPFLKSCSSYTLTPDQFQQSYYNATDYLVDSNSIQEIGEPFYRPLRLPYEQVQQMFEAVYRSNLNSNYGLWLGTTLVAYWFVIMFVAAVNHWSYFLFPNLIKSLHGPVSNTFRKYMILAPTAFQKHAQRQTRFKVIQWITPLRFESLIIMGWFILAVVFCAACINRPIQGFVALAVGSRSGELMAFSLPVLVLFAGRNNFMQWITGWPYSRFLIFHRWIARTIFCLAIVHAVTKSITLADFNSYEFYMSEHFIRWGVVGIVCVGLLVTHSAQIFRNTNYEVFVLLHITLAAIFISAGWIHTSYEDINCAEYFYACVAIWVFDRLIRLFRLVAFGIQKATVELRADETLRVTVNRPSYWKPHPGAHAFIHFIKPTYFWQSHPFTLVDSVIEPNTITFYMKVKGGITHGLYKHLVQCPDKRDVLNVLVEGPYAQKLPLYKFDNVIFVAGGTGIPGLFYEALDMATRKDTESKRIKLYWIIRQFKSIDWFYQELIKLRDTNVEPIIYVTNSQAGLDFEIGSFNSQDNDGGDDSSILVSSLKRKLSFVEFRYGRPDVSEIIREEVAETDMSIAFATCAHPCIVDDARLAIMDSLGKDRSKRIELFEEMQEW
ncbi:FAD-binding domain-containing protein [Scheffersomyces xylosifermentans]|uniref:FAD-binding domain-containing protein n=1 Tax=Scheffersomyces xylosifermentans TaxID=1304137 RepID=UPI00315CDC04